MLNSGNSIFIAVAPKQFVYELQVLAEAVTLPNNQNYLNKYWLLLAWL